MYGQKSSPVSIIIKIILILLLLFIGYKIYLYFFPNVTDITPYINMSENDLEDNLKISLEPNEKMANKIHHYSNGKVTVSGTQKGICVIYIDNKQAGIHIDSKHFSMFGINMGNAEQTVSKNTSFVYDINFTVVNDYIDSTSTSYYYCNTTTDECLIVTANGTTNRVVALTYFYDRHKALENLSY
ncbi:MAG: hypothetical protein IJC76_05435 [Lachnospiraceae bacterium]|nr:hypothetical protein [Lachnospiraceae bacterium]